MVAGEAERLHLYEIARDRWHDDEAARTLMDLLPSASDQLATKSDIAVLQQATKSESQEIRSEVNEIRSEIKVLEHRIDARTEGLRAQLLERMNEQTRTMLLANIAMWISVALLIVGLRFS